jgi:hypothetical protein
MEWIESPMIGKIPINPVDFPSAFPSMIQALDSHPCSLMA